MKPRMLTYLVIFFLVVALFTYMIYMPGKSFEGELPVLDDIDHATAKRFEAHVTELCRYPAGRNFIEKKGLDAAQKYIAGQFESSGFQVKFHEYHLNGDTVANIEVELTGTSRPKEIIIVGAHYDAVPGAPGANDNGSGVAAILELADRFKDKSFQRTVRFLAFVNEEPPNFMTSNMGSYVYAKAVAKEKENIIAMFSLETIGYFSNETGSQHYPILFNLFYPNQGNFIAFVSNLSSRKLVTRSIQLFRENSTFPSEGIAAPAFIPGISWSDHWSFWQQGYPALMITDTAPYRYPAYHTSGDTPDKVDYDKMVYVVKGIEKMIQEFLQ
ncbi:MAG: M20/M25/M40 family metallo-hydrolase [Proteobacteria bacterium]|nr:M20/M25/M40 family metallo-hydrolase [Pseudomonadota bacterium]